MKKFPPTNENWVRATIVIRRRLRDTDYLLGEYVIGEARYRRAVRHKVSDGFHDVPAVLPPSETGQHAELDAHQAEADPRHRRCSLFGLRHNLFLFLKTTNKRRTTPMYKC